MKTQHIVIAAGAIALVAFLASRGRTSSSMSSAMARNAAVSARFRQQLWSEVEPDFWA